MTWRRHCSAAWPGRCSVLRRAAALHACPPSRRCEHWVRRMVSQSGVCSRTVWACEVIACCPPYCRAARSGAGGDALRRLERCRAPPGPGGQGDTGQEAQHCMKCPLKEVCRNITGSTVHMPLTPYAARQLSTACTASDFAFLLSHPPHGRLHSLGRAEAARGAPLLACDAHPLPGLPRQESQLPHQGVAWSPACAQRRRRHPAPGMCKTNLSPGVVAQE